MPASPPSPPTTASPPPAVVPDPGSGPEAPAPAEASAAAAPTPPETAAAAEDEDTPLWDGDDPEPGGDDDGVELSAEDEAVLDDLGAEVPGESLPAAPPPVEDSAADASTGETEAEDPDSVESGETIRDATAPPEPESAADTETRAGPEVEAASGREPASSPVDEAEPGPEPEPASPPVAEAAPGPEPVSPPVAEAAPEPEVTTPPAADNPMADAAPPDQEFDSAQASEPEPEPRPEPKPIVDAPDISLFDEPPAKTNQTGAHKSPPSSWPPSGDGFKPGRARVKNLIVEKADLPEHMPLPRPTVYGGPKPSADEGE